MLMVRAPAKLNLTLEVLGKRPDGFRQKGAQPEGFHEIRSVLQSIDLCDTLHFKAGKGISFQCDVPEWSAEKSLVSRAARLLQEAAGCSKGAAIKVEKRLPLMSGLGGDSSDAAAVLRGLSKLWGLDLPLEKLTEMAVQLGSDVSFFLHGGTALAVGRGEIVTPLPPLPKMWAVLVVPDIPVEPGKTARMYASLKAGHYTDGSITEKLVTALKEGKTFKPSLLFNAFENIAFEDFNMRRVYVEHLIKLGAPHVHLAGSGPALFTMFSDKTAAEDLYNRCKDQGMKTYLASTL
jgi:4-diphosphocytidyl-2-C-methyl-D-erythritol kinase